MTMKKKDNFSSWWYRQSRYHKDEAFRIEFIPLDFRELGEMEKNNMLEKHKEKARYCSGIATQRALLARLNCN